MISKSRHALAVVLALVGCLALLSACGNGDEDALGSIDFGRVTVAACLRDGGATFAESADEVNFYSRAEKRREVSGFGVAYEDEAAELAINVWSKSMPDGRPPEWTLWVALPYTQSKNVREILEQDPPGAYVAYVFRPSASTRRKLESCVDT